MKQNVALKTLFNPPRIYVYKDRQERKKLDAMNVLVRHLRKTMIRYTVTACRMS